MRSFLHFASLCVLIPLSLIGIGGVPFMMFAYAIGSATTPPDEMAPIWFYCLVVAIPYGILGVLWWWFVAAFRKSQAMGE